jgi:hypothetical protein
VGFERGGGEHNVFKDKMMKDVDMMWNEMFNCIKEWLKTNLENLKDVGD